MSQKGTAQSSFVTFCYDRLSAQMCTKVELYRYANVYKTDSKSVSEVYNT